MDLTIKIFEIIGVVSALLFGIIAWINSNKANKISKESNEIANKSISIAESANKLSEKSLKISENAFNMNKENIEFKSMSNTVILKNIDKNNIVFEKEKDYNDFFILLTIQANNKSLQPVTIKEYSICIGTGKDNIYVYSGDIVHIKSYLDEVIQNPTKLPIYLNGNETKEFSIAVGINYSDYQHYYAKNGVTVSFKTTNSSRELSINSNNTIERLG